MAAPTQLTILFLPTTKPWRDSFLQASFSTARHVVVPERCSLLRFQKYSIGIGVDVLVARHSIASQPFGSPSDIQHSHVANLSQSGQLVAHHVPRIKVLTLLDTFSPLFPPLFTRWVGVREISPQEPEERRDVVASLACLLACGDVNAQ